MVESDSGRGPQTVAPVTIQTTSELNNLLQIIGGTTALMENIWVGNPDSEKYLQMLRGSVQRAANITAQLVEHAGGAAHNMPANRAPEAGAIKERALPVPKRQRLMIVDDEPATLVLFHRFLTDAGYEVTSAQSGFECLDRFSRAPRDFDLILLDFSMPFMDGEETFRRLRAIAPGIPVILSAGYVQQNRVDGMMAAGLCGYMRKPLPPSEVLARVSSALPAPKATAGCGITAACKEAE